MSLSAAQWLPYRRIPFQDDRYGLGDSIAALQWSSDTDAAQNQANIANLIPFVLDFYFPLAYMWLTNGATINGNVDCGVYDEAYNRLASHGGKAHAGVSVPQSFQMSAPRLLAPGRYFWAWVSSSATASFQALGQSSSLARAAGCLQSNAANAYPLPATITPAALTDGLVYRLPVGGMSADSLI